MNCEYCNKTYSTKGNLKRHLHVCKILKDKKVDEIKENYDKELLNIKYEYKKLLKEQEEKYERKLKEQEEKHLLQIEKLQDRLENLATKAIEKPTNTTNTTNTTTNNVLNLSPFDLDNEDFKAKIEEGYNMQYFLKGTRGVAEFTKDKLLKDEDGKLRYICVDPSRQIFKYVDSNGETRRDVKASKLTKKVTPDIMSKANKMVGNERNNKENFPETINKMTDTYFNLLNLNEKPDKLGLELSKITCE